jgi:hypothetical protein
MRLLFLGDIMGRAGREAVIARMPELRRHQRIDRQGPLRVRRRLHHHRQPYLG